MLLSQPAAHAPVVAIGIADADLVLDLIRIRNTRLPGALYVVAAVTLGAQAPSLIRGVALIVLFYAVAAIFNDVFDVQIDRFNGRSVPMADGRISTKSALGVMTAALFLGGFAAGGLQSSESQALMFAALVLSLVYSAPGLRVSDRGVLSPLLLAALYGGCPIFLAALEHGGPTPGGGSLTVVYGLAFCTALTKDFTDAPGDEIFGKRTPVVQFGQAAVTRGVAYVLFTVGIVAVSTVGTGLWLGPFAASMGVAIVMVVAGPSPRTVAAFRVLATITSLLVISAA